MLSFLSCPKARTQRSSGICAPQAGFGHFTVRAQSQAMTVAVFSPSPLTLSHQGRGDRRGNLDFWVEVADAFLGFVSHPLTVVAHVFG